MHKKQDNQNNLFSGIGWFIISRFSYYLVFKPLMFLFDRAGRNIFKDMPQQPAESLGVSSTISKIQKIEKPNTK